MSAKRTRIGFWPYGPTYLCGLAAAAVGAWDMAATYLVVGIPVAGAGAIMIMLALRRNLNHRKLPETAAKAALTAVARERAGNDAWLNRDARVLFTVDQEGWPLRRLLLARVDTDQTRDIEDLGRAAVTMETFILTPVLPNVVRHTSGAVMSAAGDIDMPAGPRGRLGSFYATWRAGRRGHLDVTAPELQELLTQFTEAEFIGQPGAAGHA